jgi:hypothetical protein
VRGQLRIQQLSVSSSMPMTVAPWRLEAFGMNATEGCVPVDGKGSNVLLPEQAPARDREPMKRFWAKPMI